MNPHLQNFVFTILTDVRNCRLNFKGFTSCIFCHMISCNYQNYTDNKCEQIRYCRTHNVSVCLSIAYIACGSALLYIKTLYFFLTVLALSATVANIKMRYDAKTPQFAIFGTRVIYVFYSNNKHSGRNLNISGLGMDTSKNKMVRYQYR